MQPVKSVCGCDGQRSDQWRVASINSNDAQWSIAQYPLEVVLPDEQCWLLSSLWRVKQAPADVASSNETPCCHWTSI